MDFSEIVAIADLHNEAHMIMRQYQDKYPLYFGVVFEPDFLDWGGGTDWENTFIFRSDEKYFLGTMLGSSIFAWSVVDNEQYVRLDYFLHSKGIKHFICYGEIDPKKEDNKQS